MSANWTAELPSLTQLPNRPRLFCPVPVVSLDGTRVGLVEELRLRGTAVAAGTIDMRALRRADREAWEQVCQRRALFVQVLLSCNQEFVVQLDVDVSEFSSLDVGVMVFGSVPVSWWRRWGLT